MLLYLTYYIYRLMEEQLFRSSVDLKHGKFGKILQYAQHTMLFCLPPVTTQNKLSISMPVTIFPMLYTAQIIRTITFPSL